MVIDWAKKKGGVSPSGRPQVRAALERPTSQSPGNRGRRRWCDVDALSLGPTETNATMWPLWFWPALLLLLGPAHRVDGHGRLVDPPSRATAWR